MIYPQNLLDQFPGRIITAELPKLPRPEIGRVLPGQVFGRQSVFHPVMEKRKELMPLVETLQRIQRHILEHRIRINEFFRVWIMSSKHWAVHVDSPSLQTATSRCFVIFYVDVFAVTHFPAVFSDFSDHPFLSYNFFKPKKEPFEKS